MEYTEKNSENLAIAGILILFSACMHGMLTTYLFFIYPGAMHPAPYFNALVVVASTFFVKKISQKMDTREPSPDEKALAYGAIASILSGTTAMLVPILAIGLPTILVIAGYSQEAVMKNVTMFVTIV